MTVRNNLLYYKIADIFQLSTLIKTSMFYAESCFLMVAETDNFLELDFALVKKILQSSKLHVTSELEIFYAANEWISYKLEERSKFAKNLLLTVRLPLLSDPALKSLLCRNYFICKSDECKKILENVLHKKTNLLSKLLKSMFVARYCDHDLFNILTLKKNGNLIQISGKDFRRNRPAIKYIKNSENEFIVKGFCIKGDMYVLKIKKNKLIIIKKYLQISKTWITVGNLKHRNDFCASVLIDKIYIMGGEFSYSKACTSCIQYGTKTKEQKEISKMSLARWGAASTAYEGKLVVSGGMFFNADVQQVDITNTVEVYDHIDNTWTYMPNMVAEKYYHSLVSIGSKLFVIEIFYSGEVYDKVTNIFTLIKPSETSFKGRVMHAVSMGNKIVVFVKDQSKVMFYDTCKDEWSEKTYDCLKNKGCTTFIKMLES